MRPLIQKQQQILKQNLQKFENRATQITYSLNKIQYLLFNNHENELNKEFIKNEYRFLQTLVGQVGDDLDAFQNSSAVLLQMANNNSQLSVFPNLQQNNANNEIKVEEDEDGVNDKEMNSQSNYDDIDEDEDDEYDEQQSQQKSNLHQGVITRKKNIEKDKGYSQGYQNSSHNRNSNHRQSNNESSSVSESQNYIGNSNSRQVRKKKYSEELRKKLIVEIQKKNISYRRICKKYNINYGTAYYLVNSIQKELGEQAQQSQTANTEGGNTSAQKSALQTTNISETQAQVQAQPQPQPQAQQPQPQTQAQGQSTSSVNKVNSTQGEKQVIVTETGRNKYPEEFKQKLYVELACGLAYKDISDKYGVSYETCYYLINTIRNQVSKDQQLNRSLKAQIAAYQEQQEQTKGSGTTSAKTYNSKSNIIPTTTTLTRSQQAMLNGTTNQNNEKKNETNTISIDEEEDEQEIEIDDQRFVNLDEKQNSNNKNIQQKIEEEVKQLKSPKVLQEEEDDQGFNEENYIKGEESDKMIDESSKSDDVNQDNQDEKQKQKKSPGQIAKKDSKKGEQDSSLNTQKKDSQGSTKVGGSTDDDNAVSE